MAALVACGLFHKTHDYFPKLKGYYRLEHIFLVLAFMALTRLKSMEQLRFVSPGDKGKGLGPRSDTRSPHDEAEGS